MSFYTNFAIFKTEICGTFFQRYLQEHEAFDLYFLYKNESLQHCLLYDLRQMATFSVFEVWFFCRVRFLEGSFFLRSRVQIQVWVQILDDTQRLGQIIQHPTNGTPIRKSPENTKHQTNKTNSNTERQYWQKTSEILRVAPAHICCYKTITQSNEGYSKLMSRRFLSRFYNWNNRKSFRNCKWNESSFLLQLWKLLKG